MSNLIPLYWDLMWVESFERGAEGAIRVSSKEMTSALVVLRSCSISV